MFKRYLEYKEYKQLRKEHKAKQLMRFRIIFLAIMGGLLFAFAGIEMATPPESAKSDSAVSVADQKEDIQQEQQVTSEIERFAYVITKPLDQLTSEDLDFVEEKAGDPCYEDNASLPQEQMVDAITACKFPK